MPHARAAVLSLLVLAGCTAPSPESPAVRVEAGRADTLAMADVVPGADAGVEFGDSPDARVEALAGGLVVIETPAGFSGLAQVPYRAAGRPGVLVVHSVAAGAPAGTLRLAVDGTEAEHPDVLAFSVVRRDASGASVPPELHDEESVVALVGAGAFNDNAIDAYDDYVRLDLDAVGPGRHRLRVAVQSDGLVSNWIEIPLQDGRPVSD